MIKPISKVIGEQNKILQNKRGRKNKVRQLLENYVNNYIPIVLNNLEKKTKLGGNKIFV